MESSDLESSEFLFAHIELCQFLDREDLFIFGACLGLDLALLLQSVEICIKEF